MGHDIEHLHLHHVGHVVSDLEEGLALYRQLGFHLSPPACPVLSLREGEPPRPIGAANTHANFPRSFVELMSCVSDEDSDRLPRGARRIPIQAPPEHLPRITAAIRGTVARVASCLARFQGLHILVFKTSLVADADLDALLPGERAPALPAFVAYAVAVRDLGAARRLLEENGFPLRRSAAGDLFIPAAAALGAAVVFRQAD
ncbi:VOC family protein [Sorangium sp. So ce429]